MHRDLSIGDLHATLPEIDRGLPSWLRLEARRRACLSRRHTERAHEAKNLLRRARVAEMGHQLAITGTASAEPGPVHPTATAFWSSIPPSMRGGGELQMSESGEFEMSTDRAMSTSA
jgi:hypothetical protein